MSNTVDVMGYLLDAPEEERLALLNAYPEAADVVLQQARQELAEASPLGLAQVINEGHRDLPHLDYLDARLLRAVRKVEAGGSAFIRISMPPRSGKSVTTSEYLPLWLLMRHPDWRVGLISHAPALAAGWGRAVRRMIEENRDVLGLEVARDAGSVTDWETTKRGGISSRSVGQSITGRGFKVMIVDDVVKDYADAASETRRQHLRDWWQTTARTRLEPPGLVIVIGTRWHEDDFTGWVDTAGDPFETIIFEAIATEHDDLGRSPGDPLYSPFVTETREEALARWAQLETAVGPYAWAALYQQDPQPAGGTILHRDWFRYWTRLPHLVSENTVLLVPESTPGLTWLDSWDIAIEESEQSDYTVGQRWARDGDGRKFLIGQTRQQTVFNDTLATMREWAKPESMLGTGRQVYRRLVERAANGYAVIDTLAREMTGIEGVNPKGSKEVRAYAITPEVAAGEVYLPHPSEPGNEWVHLLVDELAKFPTAKHDDQVDAFTQALLHLRVRGNTHITNPADLSRGLPATASRTVSAARTGVRRSPAG
ncbi:terminase large subunit [Microbacterium phage Quhwah]|uniref:Terminase n=1 Tax=Microbacterium phage Quhwah TaxID=2992929 RepID=A0A2Z4QAT0_9CAUD|nr:terminase large subunit [Microbacterium phage Quhwah]AWY06713.1 terminase [Microbacterium phage Quhwah]QDF19019.1 terminase [Microbacterium phage Busephilis]